MSSDIARRAVQYLPRVKRQYRRPQTAGVKEAVDRLVLAGASFEIAMMMVAAVLGDHLERSKAENRPFDYSAYVADAVALTSSAWND